MDANNSYFHCTSERHFAHLKGHGAHHASLLYTFSLRLAGKKRTFFCSVPRLADYFGVDERTIRHAIHHLKYTGFFELLRNERGGDGAVVYKPLYHGERIEKFGAGQCVQKLDMPWQGEEMEPLGQALYAASGGRFKPYKNLAIGIRNAANRAGLTDAAVLLHFAAFVEMDRPSGKRWVNGFAGRFVKYLRNVADSPTNPSHKMHLAGTPTALSPLP